MENHIGWCCQIINLITFRQRHFTLNIKGPTDPVDELRKYKELLDDGIITESEFEAKKKQILGL